MKKVKNDLFDYQNRYIIQYRENFKFSLDSVLLSEFVSIKPKDNNILDFCTGNVPIPLILSLKTSKHIVGFEIQKKIYDLGIESIKINNLENQITIINDDIKNIGNYYQQNYFDIITCNPPYFEYSKTNIINENDSLAIARHEIYLNLEDVFILASKYLKSNGTLYLVHRVNRLDEIIILANKYKINVKNIQLIATKIDNNPSLILIKCVKNAKKGVIISPVINVSSMKTYQNIFRK